MKAYDVLSKCYVTVRGPAGGVAAERCVVVVDTAGRVYVQFKSLIRMK